MDRVTIKIVPYITEPTPKILYRYFQNSPKLIEDYYQEDFDACYIFSAARILIEQTKGLFTTDNVQVLKDILQQDKLSSTFQFCNVNPNGWVTDKNFRDTLGQFLYLPYKNVIFDFNTRSFYNFLNLEILQILEGQKLNEIYSEYFNETLVEEFKISSPEEANLEFNDQSFINKFMESNQQQQKQFLHKIAVLASEPREVVRNHFEAMIASHMFKDFYYNQDIQFKFFQVHQNEIPTLQELQSDFQIVIISGSIVHIYDEDQSFLK